MKVFVVFVAFCVTAYAQIFIPNCSYKELGIRWPYYENKHWFYDCQKLYTPALLVCSSNTVFNFVYQKCTEEYLYIDPPPPENLPTEFPPINGNPPPSTTPITPTTPTTPAPATDPPATDPPVTDPPATDPPATDPPATDPPATDPPATDPPATDPPATDPPATPPAATTIIPSPPSPPPTDIPTPPTPDPTPPTGEDKPQTVSPLRWIRQVLQASQI